MMSREDRIPLYVLGPAALAVLALVGWVIDSALLRQLIPGGSAMQPFTAIGLLSLALGVWATHRKHTVLGLLAVALPLTLGLVELALILAGADASFERSLFPFGDVQRVSPATAACFVAYGASLLLFRRGLRSWLWVQLLTFSAAFVSTVVLISFSYGLQLSERAPFLSTMALGTALSFFGIGSALLAMTHNGPLSAIFTADTSVARLGRKLAAFLMPLPWLIGLIAIRIDSVSTLGTPLALALVTVLCMALFGVGIMGFTSVASQQERDYGITLDSIGDAVLVTDAQGRIVRLNPVAEKLTGWTMAEAKGLPVEQVFNIINEGTRAVVESPVTHVIRDGNVVGLANHTLLIDKQGLERPIADSGAPVRDNTGRLRGVVLVFRDMTAESEARHALEKTVSTLRAVMDATPVGMVASRNGIGVYANPAAMRVYGMSALADYVGFDLIKMVTPEAVAAMKRRHADWAASGQAPGPMRMEIIRVTGERVVIDSMPVKSDVELDGQRVQLSMIQVVGENDALVARLARQNTFTVASNELSRLMMEARFDVGAVLDVMVRLVTPRPGELAHIRLLARDEQSLSPISAAYSSDPVLMSLAAEFATPAPMAPLGKLIFGRDQPLVLPADKVRELASPQVRKVLESLAEFTAAFIPMRAQGRVLGLLVVGRPSTHGFDADELLFLADMANRAAQAVLNAQLYEDATNAFADKERSAEQLRVTEAQLRHSQKLEALGQLAGGVAHDFNNLLSVILSLSDMLLASRSPDDPEHADLSDIKAAGERAAELTRQLLAFSRKQMMQVKAVEVNLAIREMRSILQRLLGEDVTLELSLEEGLPLVRADPSLLSQVLINLAVNARDAMPTGGTLVVRSTVRSVVEARPAQGLTPGQWVCVDVEDDGTGISAEVMERLFEPFFTTKPRGKGTGLGLSTSYGIARQTGGTMTVKSEPGLGSTFTLWIPILTEPPPPATPPSPVVTRKQAGTVLLVEDEKMVRDVAQRVLEQAGYTLIVASSAEDALEKYPQLGVIDLLLTDVVMPGRSGRELADMLLEKRPGLKVLFMSGYTEDAVVQRGVFEAHGSMIQKPFTPESLLRAVHKATE